MSKQKKTNRQKVAELLSSGITGAKAAKKLRITRQAVHQLKLPRVPRPCACGTCGLSITGRSVRYHPDCPNRDLKRRCRCGCGAEMITPRVHYLPGHKPEPIRLCRCGCGGVVTEKYQQYLPGHKPTKGDQT